jgi:hypothetical protein
MNEFTLRELVQIRRRAIAEEKAAADFIKRKTVTTRQEKLNLFTADCRRIGNELNELPGVYLVNTPLGFTFRNLDHTVRADVRCRWTTVDHRPAQTNDPQPGDQLCYIIDSHILSSPKRGWSAAQLRDDLVNFAAEYL